MKGSTEQTNKKDTFYLDQRNLNGDTWADIQVNYPLDYERIQQYNLTVRVEVSLIRFYNLSSWKWSAICEMIHVDFVRMYCG